MINSILNLFGFLSILPTGMPDSLEDVAKNMYLFPLVGLVLGTLAGLSLRAFTTFFPLTIAAILGYFVMQGLTGLHHLDGLLDFGDALIFRGSKERRIKVMHDTSMGVGGFTIGLFTILIGVTAAYEFIHAGGSPIKLFLVSEVLAKLAMVFVAGVGGTAFEGMGSVFTNTIKKSRWQMVLSFLISGAVIWVFYGYTTPALLAVALISALFFARLSNRLIGGVSGDVFGTVNEVTRILAMLVMVWML